MDSCVKKCFKTFHSQQIFWMLLSRLVTLPGLYKSVPHMVEHKCKTYASDTADISEPPGPWISVAGQERWDQPPPPNHWSDTVLFKGTMGVEGKTFPCSDEWCACQYVCEAQAVPKLLKEHKCQGRTSVCASWLQDPVENVPVLCLGASLWDQAVRTTAIV